MATTTNAKAKAKAAPVRRSGESFADYYARVTAPKALLAAVRAGYSPGEYSRLGDFDGYPAGTWYDAELAADPSLAIGSTPSALAEAKRNGRSYDGTRGLRVERLAVYSGLAASLGKGPSFREVRARLAKAEGKAVGTRTALGEYVGRGRRNGRVSAAEAPKSKAEAKREREAKAKAREAKAKARAEAKAAKAALRPGVTLDEGGLPVGGAAIGISPFGAAGADAAE